MISETSGIVKLFLAS